MQPDGMGLSLVAPDRRPFFSPDEDPQRNPILEGLVGELIEVGQGEEPWHDAPLVRRPPREIPIEDYSQLSNEAAAIRYCVNHCGLHEKVIAIETKTDAGTFSKAKAGQARLNDDALHELMDLTGIEAPLVAMLLRRGYDPRSLRRIESDVERENRELRERLSQVEREREIERRTVRDIIGARA
jgi:hypothetical protein